MYAMPSLFSPVQFFATLWTVACQALLSMGFFRQEYWTGLSFPLPKDLPDPRIEPMSLGSPHVLIHFGKVGIDSQLTL